MDRRQAPELIIMQRTLEKYGAIMYNRVMKNASLVAFKKYMDTVLEIRTLSSPLVGDTVDGVNYHQLLMDNFARIGELSIENQRILDEFLYPLLNKKYDLSNEERSVLWAFSHMLLDAYKMENIHVLLRYRITDKLLQDAEKKQDLREIILSLDAKVEASFVTMHNAARLNPCDTRSFAYRETGFEAANRLLEWLDEDKFRTLPDEECRHIVLVNSRYISSLFDRSDHYCAETNRSDFAMMKRALALKDDPFYVQQAPGYDWKYHEFRTLQYITNFTEIGNVRGFSRDELLEIRGYTERLKELFESDEETLSAYCSRGMMDLYTHRIAYLCGDLDLNTYKKVLFELTTNTDPNEFSLHENTTFVISFAEYLMVADRKRLSNRDRSRFAYIYQSIISYVHHVPKMQGFSFLLTFLSIILKNYIEIGGREREYEKFCLELLAALHPPTYVHVLSVADLSKALALHLYHEQPERFIGFMGCETVADVNEKLFDILEFCYHAALCHDFGKLFVAETIITYDRKLLDEEFDLIKSHPLIGAYILEQHEDTRAYANIARFHHQWFDGRGGYPLEDAQSLPEKVVIDIVRCADCLDASTDTVGRSYKKGLTVDQICRELKEGSGSVYAGYLADLISQDKVKEDIENIISTRRVQNYYRAYKTLSKSEEIN